MSLKIFLLIISLFFYGCNNVTNIDNSQTIIIYNGCNDNNSTIGGNSIEDNINQIVNDTINNSIKNNRYSFNELKGYAFTVAMDKQSIKFELNEIGEESIYLHKYFDGYNYVISRDNKKAIIDNNIEIKISEIEYRLLENGLISARYNSQEIFKLQITNKEKYNSTSLSEIDADNINLSGYRYSVEEEYLRDFYKIDKIAPGGTFDTLTQFIDKHRDTPFTGATYTGLVFDGSDKLLRLEYGKYREAGSYEVKKINDNNVIFIHPKDTLNYDANGCYIFDSSYNIVLKATCFSKNDKNHFYIYDDAILNSILEYLRNLSEITMEF